MHSVNPDHGTDHRPDRRVNSARNASTVLLISLVTLVTSFVNRTVFVRCLSAEYIGLGGLLGNLLGLLSLAELGIGSAIHFALYRSLGQSDIEKAKSLMAVYRRLYRWVGFSILGIGVLLTPILPRLIKELPETISISEINLYYWMYLGSASLSYFFSYKRALIICDQREYISTLTGGLFHVVAVALQASVLLLTHSYIAYLAISLLLTLAENLTISSIANRLYPFLREKTVADLSTQELQTLRRNISAQFLHRVGGIVVFSSDNIIISKFVGLMEAGLYSNYTLILTSVNGILNRMISAVTASVGNLMAGSDDSHSESVFYHVLFLNAWLYGFASVCLLCLFQPFIRLWLGEDYLLTDMTVAMIVASFYINGIRLTLLIFKDASGIFTQDRYKPLVEAAVNILISIPLAIRYGVMGVLLGTVISTLTVAFWYEAYVFFRVRYGKGLGRYLFCQFEYLAITFLAVLLCRALCTVVPSDTPGAFLARMAICLLVPNVLFYICFKRTADFAYVKEAVLIYARRWFR